MKRLCRLCISVANMYLGWGDKLTFPSLLSAHPRYSTSFLTLKKKTFEMNRNLHFSCPMGLINRILLLIIHNISILLQIWATYSVDHMITVD